MDGLPEAVVYEGNVAATSDNDVVKNADADNLSDFAEAGGDLEALADRAERGSLERRRRRAFPSVQRHEPYAWRVGKSYPLFF